MKRISRIVVPICLIVTFTIQPMIPFVNPQPGENLWGLVSREGTALDYILNKSDCCACQFFLDSSNTPTLITNPGVYCVTEDISTTATAITIFSDDVVLNLQGNTVNSDSGDAILVTGGFRIQILNGIVTAGNGTGVRLGIPGGFGFNFFIRDILALECNTGFWSEPDVYSGIEYFGCTAQFCTGNGFDGQLSGAHHIYRQCVAYSSSGTGFNLGNNGGAGAQFAILIDSCTSLANNVGFNIFDLSNVLIQNCYAVRNVFSGFVLTPSISLGIVQKCQAINNGFGGSTSLDGSGFYSDGSVTFMSCIAMGNGYAGLSSIGTSNRLYNNFANGNGAGGNFVPDGINLVLPSSDLLTNNNISWWANIDGGGA